MTPPDVKDVQHLELEMPETPNFADLADREAAARSEQGLAVLPTSLSFENAKIGGVARPSSLTAQYGRGWYTWGRRMGVRDLTMQQHRREHGHSGRGPCTSCGRMEGTLRMTAQGLAPVRNQLAHMDWDPGNLSAKNLRPRCEQCHRAWDKPHQDAAAALTMAGERTLTYEKYRARLLGLSAVVERGGLVRLSPSMTDLAVAACLQDGRALVEELPARLGRWFPAVSRAVRGYSPDTELERMHATLEAALTRLGMRRSDETDVPFVVRRFDTVQLTLPRLHLDPSVQHTPHSRWTAPRYVARRQA